MTVPVPLTDIERRTFWPIGKGSTYHHGCPSCDRQDPEDR